jgi:formylglycine-generating enzyme required for sulfatase activity
VTAYEGKGDSPFGVVDMAGNVWEWTATTYQNGNNMDILDTNNSRVLRGGSWGNNNTDDFRLAFRDGHGPNHGSLSGGFRLALS